MDEQLRKAIDDLEACKHADAVAVLMRDNECSGRMGETDICPVANYLIKIGGVDPARVSVSDSEICFGNDKVDTPRGVARFIVEFDSGTYPDLED